MLVRMFGLFGVMLAFGYLIQGLTYVLHIFVALERRAYSAFVWRFIIMSLDFSFGISLLIAAIGLFFVKEWARQMWLLVLSILVIVHLFIVVRGEVTGAGVDNFYLVFTWMVLVATALSWWYLTRSSVSSLFRPKEAKEPEIKDESANPADASS